MFLSFPDKENDVCGSQQSETVLLLHLLVSLPLLLHDWCGVLWFPVTLQNYCCFVTFCPHTFCSDTQIWQNAPNVTFGFNRLTVKPTTQTLCLWTTYCESQAPPPLAWTPLNEQTCCLLLAAPISARVQLIRWGLEKTAQLAVRPGHWGVRATLHTAVQRERERADVLSQKRQKPADGQWLTAQIYSFVCVCVCVCVCCPCKSNISTATESQGSSVPACPVHKQPSSQGRFKPFWGLWAGFDDPYPKFIACICYNP